MRTLIVVKILALTLLWSFTSHAENVIKLRFPESDNYVKVKKITSSTLDERYREVYICEPECQLLIKMNLQQLSEAPDKEESYDGVLWGAGAGTGMGLFLSVAKGALHPVGYLSRSVAFKHHALYMSIGAAGGGVLGLMIDWLDEQNLSSLEKQAIESTLINEQVLGEGVGEFEFEDSYDGYKIALEVALIALNKIDNTLMQK
ncbi:MAG: hypothetical protein KDD40_04985 [Bdellovibrionales bacterium]|nr:hypothetical protein [Bdellovibrionales bacterium]